jgi:hypothetical protein
MANKETGVLTHLNTLFGPPQQDIYTVSVITGYQEHPFGGGFSGGWQSPIREEIPIPTQQFHKTLSHWEFSSIFPDGDMSKNFGSEVYTINLDLLARHGGTILHADTWGIIEKNDLKPDYQDKLTGITIDGIQLRLAQTVHHMQDTHWSPNAAVFHTIPLICALNDIVKPQKLSIRDIIPDNHTLLTSLTPSKGDTFWAGFFKGDSTIWVLTSYTIDDYIYAKRKNNQSHLHIQFHPPQA